MPSVCGVKVNRIGHCFKFKHNGRKRSILKLEERFGSVRTNEFIRIQPSGNDYDARFKFPAGNNINSAQHCFLSRRISVIGITDPLCKPSHEAHLLACKRGAEGSNGVVDSGLMKADNIHITFDHDKLIKLSPFHKVDGIDIVTLVIDERVSGVHILCTFALADDASAERKNASACGNDGKHQPVVKKVKGFCFILASFDAKSGRNKLIARVTCGGHMFKKFIPIIG